MMFPNVLGPDEMPGSPGGLVPGEYVSMASPVYLELDGAFASATPGFAYLTQYRVCWVPQQGALGPLTASGDVSFGEIREVKTTKHHGRRHIPPYGVQIITDDHDLLLTLEDEAASREWSEYLVAHSPNLAAPGTAKSRRSFRPLLNRRAGPLFAVLLVMVVVRILRILPPPSGSIDPVLVLIALTALGLAAILYFTGNE